jgi:glycosyltransferase involved in cell wall biosynthesis
MMTGLSLIGMLALGLRLRKKSCLFIHFHHTGVKKKWQWKLMYLIADTIFVKIYFASNFILQEALEIYPSISNKSSYLPNPLPSKELISGTERGKCRKKFEFEDNDIVIGNAGWLIKRKRFDIFLTTCAKLKERNLNIKILIAGEGEEKECLLRLSKKLGIEDDITWLGWVGDLTSFHNSIDFMLFNSDWDSVGLSPLETIQLGIPTFSSVINGGLKEILTDNFSIFLQDTHDTEKLANKIHYAIENKNEIMDLTLKCRDHINQLSDPNLLANKVLNDLNN